MFIWCTGSGWLCSVEVVVWFGILGRLKEKRKSGQSFVSLNFLLSSNSFSQIQTQLCQAKPMVILKNERWVVWCGWLFAVVQSANPISLLLEVICIYIYNNKQISLSEIFLSFFFCFYFIIKFHHHHTSSSSVVVVQ